jgi:hypothetical protein
MRRVPKHAWLIVRAPVLVVSVRSCGTTRSGPTTTPATSAPMAAATPTTASTFTVPTAPATVNGKTVTILTDGQGRTLYSSPLMQPQKRSAPAGVPRPGPRCSSLEQASLRPPRHSWEHEKCTSIPLASRSSEMTILVSLQRRRCCWTNESGRTLWQMVRSNT